MAITSERVPYAATILVVQQTAASAGNTSIAAQLNAAGHTVPRQAGVDPRNARYSHGYALNTFPGDPGKWNAAAVAEVVASTEVAAVIAGTASPATLGPTAALTIT